MAKLTKSFCLSDLILLTYLQNEDKSLYLPLYLIESSKEINLRPGAVSRSVKNLLLLAVCAKICVNVYVIFCLNLLLYLNCHVQLITIKKESKKS